MPDIITIGDIKKKRIELKEGFEKTKEDLKKLMDNIEKGV